MRLKINCLSLLICSLFMCSCGSNGKNEMAETRILENYFLLSDDLVGIENVLIVPAELTCESCVATIVSYVNTLEIPNNTRIIFSSYSKESIDIFLDKNKIELRPSIYLDSGNYFFLKGVLLIHPVLMVRNKQKAFIRNELYPVNVEPSLLEVFRETTCNKFLIDEFKPLSFKGDLVRLIEMENGIEAYFKSDQTGTEMIFISDNVRTGFSKAFILGSYYSKDHGNLEFIEFTTLNDSSAVYRTKQMTCF